MGEYKPCFSSVDSDIHAALTLNTDQKLGNREKMDRCHKVLFQRKNSGETEAESCQD